MSRINALQQFTSRKIDWSIAYAKEESLTCHRENAESLQDCTVSGIGLGPGWGMNLGFFQLHLREPWSRATDVVAHTPVGSALNSGVTGKPHQTTQHTWEVYPPVFIPGLHSNTNRGCQNTSCLCGGQKSGEIQGEKCFGNGFISENFNFQSSPSPPSP